MMPKSNPESYPPIFRPTQEPNPEDGPSPMDKCCNSGSSSLDSLPLIDMECLEVHELDRACREWGIFRLVNHGVPPALLGQLQEHAKNIFNMPFESKQALTGSVKYFWGTPALSPAGVVLPRATAAQNIDWVEGLNVPLSQIPSSLNDLHHLPTDLHPLIHTLSNLLENYGGHLRRVGSTLFEAMMRNLKLEKELPKTYLDERTGMIRIYRYPHNNQAEHVVGMHVHTDSSVLSILSEDQVGGLQFLKDDQWQDIIPIPTTLVVNLGDMMQVKSIEDGFQGSWHIAEIIECRSGVRKVRYKELLCDDESEYLTEFIEVTSNVDGVISSSVTSNDFRGRIRPCPPVRELVREDISYGLCVDAKINDAWWEGVVFDRRDGSDNRNVFFPDLGDEHNVEIQDLRITQDWDESSTDWKPRGNWLFLEVIEEYERDGYIPVSLKQIWYDVREKKEFCKVGVWASSVKSLWEKLIMEVIDVHMGITVDEILASYKSTEALLDNGEPIGADQFALTCEPNLAYSFAVVAPMDIALRDANLTTEHEGTMTVAAKNAEMALDLQGIGPSSGEAVPSSDQLIPVQPSALSVICYEAPCSGASKKRVGKHKLNKNSGSYKTSQRSKKSKFNWKPVLKLQKVYSPHSISEYIQKDYPSYLTKTVRNHVFCLGYKVESSRQSNQSRVRYTSPEGKTFYDLRTLCKYLEENSSPEESSSPTTEDAQKMLSLSPDNMNSVPLVNEQRTSCGQPGSVESTGTLLACKSRDPCVVAEYCPQAVLEYVDASKKRSGSREHLSKLQDKARNHLAAIGWDFAVLKKRQSNEWRYYSPSGKTYNSLKLVCNAIAEGNELNTRDDSGPVPNEDVMCSEESKVPFDGELSLCNAVTQCHSVSQKPRTIRIICKPGTSGVRKDQKKKTVSSSSSLLHSDGQDQLLEDHEFTHGLKNGGRQCSRRLSTSFLSKKRKALSRVRRTSDGNKLTRVLRSSKRVRQAGPVTSSQAPRTVISWLIDNDVSLARTKIIYRRERDAKVAADGRITRDGIKCNCCGEVFSLSGFGAHADNNYHRPAANLFFEDGRSLLECQMQMIHQTSRHSSRELVDRARGDHGSWNDHVCSICHYGGKLILCDKCPSSFHANCLNLQKIPEGDWFCPSCCCTICGESQYDVSMEFTGKSVLSCQQCERQYHAQCIRDREMINLDVRPTENWFCCKMCEKVHWGLQQLLDKPILVGQNNLTWTLMKPMNYDISDQDDCDIVTVADNYSKLNVALEVMHECFEPVKEPLTRRDLVEDVVFSRSSHLNRLNFRGFYTVLLERNDELISVANLRVYGDKVAEIPLVGTRFQHRRLGMCRVLMNELEKNLKNLGVNRLVLPAAASVLNTWTTSFGFSPVTQSDRAEFLGFTFLEFQDTVMCQKLLRKLPLLLPRFWRGSPGIHSEPRQSIEGHNSIMDFEGNSSISEVHQGEQQVGGSESVDQGPQVIGTENKHNDGSNGLDCPAPMVTDSSKQASEPCRTLDLIDQKKVNRDKCDGNLKFYKRKKATELRPSITQADCPKLEVSCR